MLGKRVFYYLLVIFLFMGVILANSELSIAADSYLSWGSKGTEVVSLQKALNNKGYSAGPIDGIFGPKTYAAVVKFQKNAGLTVDGIVGPNTKKALGLSSTPTQVSRGGNRTINMVATGYCPCAKCNYPWGGKPSYLGYPLGRGIVAVDPNVIPMGTRLYIEGYGEGIAADQGGAIKGNRIDLCFDTHSEALNWGIRNVKVIVY